jgi:hypothetical protein
MHIIRFMYLKLSNSFLGYFALVFLNTFIIHVLKHRVYDKHTYAKILIEVKISCQREIKYSKSALSHNFEIFLHTQHIHNFQRKNFTMFF